LTRNRSLPGSRQTAQCVGTPEALADVLIDDRPCTINSAGEGPRSVPSSARSHYGPGEPHHLFSNGDQVLDRNRLPFCRGVPGSFGHDTGQRCDSLSVECGLCDTALAQPEVTLARQEAVAEHRSKLVVERTLAVVAGVDPEEHVERRWAGNQVAAPRPDFEIDNVAEAARRIHEDARRVASYRRQHAMPTAGRPRVESSVAPHLSVKLSRLHAGMTRAGESLESSQLRGGA
jgi:hypothetical protein